MAKKKPEKPKKSKVAVPDQENKNTFSLERIKVFIQEVKAEFAKIVWPDKKVTLGSTGVVIILVSIISIYLGAVDLLIGKLVTYVLR